MAGRFTVESVFKAVDKISAPVSRMQNRLGQFTRSAERGLRGVNRVIDRTAGLAKGLTFKALRAGAAAAAASAVALTLALNNTADAADVLAKQSRRLQFPVEELQEWKFVSEQSGVSTELLDKSLGAFTKRLGEAKAGAGPLVSGLKNLNPQLLKQLTNTESVADAFALYIDAMRGADTATEKAALANAAFSRSGLDLVNISENSTAAIAAMRQEQRENGVITMQQAEAAEAYNDAVNSLKRALLGTLQGALLPMMPVLSKTVREWRDLVAVNREAIQTKVAEYFQRIKQFVSTAVVAVREFFEENDGMERVETVVRKTADAFAWLYENGGTVVTLGKWLLGLSIVVKVLTGALALFNLVAMANPVGLIIVGVVALVAALTALVVWVDDVVAAFDDMHPAMRLLLAPWELIARSVKFVKDNIGAIIDAASKVAGITGAVLTAPSRAGAWIGGMFRGDDEEAAAPPPPAQMVTREERMARSIEESRTTAEVTIRDETGRAEQTGGRMGAGVTLAPSGTF